MGTLEQKNLDLESQSEELAYKVRNLEAELNSSKQERSNYRSHNDQFEERILKLQRSEPSSLSTI